MAPAFSTWKGQRSGKSARVFRTKGVAAAARATKANDRRTLVAVAKSVARSTALSKENKYFDNTGGTFAFDTTGQRSDLCIIPTGTGVQARIGKMVQLDSVQIRGSVLAGSGSKEHCTLMLVYDREPNAAAAVPAATDILMTASSNALTNRDNAPRFKIVRRWDFDIVGTPGTASVAAESQKVIEEYVKLGPKYPIKWQGANTDGSTAAKVKGNLILMSIGNNANGAATPSLTCNVRVNFSDS